MAMALTPAFRSRTHGTRQRKADLAVKPRETGRTGAPHGFECKPEHRVAHAKPAKGDESGKEEMDKDFHVTFGPVQMIHACM